MQTEKICKIERAECPEHVGISSAAVRTFIERIEEKNANWHSVTFIKNGKVAAEAYRRPYSPDSVHCMFSISKNITSLALGFAVTEGLVSLDDRVIKFFPEYNMPEDKYLQKLLVRHLASMCSGKAPADLQRKTADDWIKQYFDLKWEAAPGRLFHYVNENCFILSEILRRATGQRMTDFLTPRLFSPLGIPSPFWETDINGTEAGGWGLYLAPEDFAKIFLCIQQKGIYNGKQVIPYSWLSVAALNQTELHKYPGPCKKENGYGFSFWLRKRDLFYGEGMYGQIGAIDEKTGVLFVITGCETKSDKYWSTYLDMRNEFVCPADENAVKNTEFADFLNSFAADDITASEIRSPLEEKINDTRFSSSFLPIGQKIGFGLSIIPAASVYMSHDTGGNIDNIKINFGKDDCTFSWTENGEPHTVTCGMDGKYRYKSEFMCGARYTFAAYAVWTDDNTLQIHLRSMQSVGKRVLEFDFSDFRKITVTPASQPPLTDILDSVKWAVYENFTSRPARRAVDKFLSSAPKIIEPKIKLKI